MSSSQPSSSSSGSASTSASASTTNSQFKCERTGCDALSSFRCPTCTKLGIPDSYYCSQSCFQRNWKNHKKIHTLFVTMCEEEAKKYDRLGGTYVPWPNYSFTGKLRPFPPVERRTVPERIARPDYADDVNGKPVSEIAARNSNAIKVLHATEIEKMRTVCRLGREVLDEAAKAIRVGATTAEIDRVVFEACMERDCYPSPLNYYTFPASCCTSVNEVICHGIPDKRPLEDGDLCNVDVTVYFDGFHGDLNETFLVGNVTEPHRKLVNVTYECLTKAISIVKPGVKYREIGNVIQKHAQMQGFQVVRSYCGHGIHRLFHTAPNVPHYAKNNAVGVMKEGHCFTIEPMISEGTWRDQKWPDNWTAVTTDGSWSAQFEHTLLVTATGCDILTQRRTTSGLPHFLDSTVA